jgi:hypothetical protein
MSSEDNSGYKITVFSSNGDIPFEIVEPKEGEEKSEVRLIRSTKEWVKDKIGWGTKENAIEPSLFEKEILQFVSQMKVSFQNVMQLLLTSV